jgi:chemotaxis protein methyltransferase CheR
VAFTFFFRDRDALDLAADHLIPLVSGRSRIRIWDAGCATGHEPYTLAILLAERMGTFGFRNVRIYATDYDEPLLTFLKRGVYPMEELKRLPEGIFEKYFGLNGGEGEYKVIDKIREALVPMHHDLLTLKQPAESFSLIVCKNVLLHFSPAQRVNVIRMFHHSLEPGGMLVMERTQDLPEGVRPLFHRISPRGQLYGKVEPSFEHHSRN